MEKREITNEALRSIDAMRRLAQSNLANGSSFGLAEAGLIGLESLAAELSQKLDVPLNVEERLEKTRRYYQSALTPTMYEKWAETVLPELRKTYAWTEHVSRQAESPDGE